MQCERKCERSEEEKAREKGRKRRERGKKLMLFVIKSCQKAFSFR